MPNNVRYLIFDVESVADAELVTRLGLRPAAWRCLPLLLTLVFLAAGCGTPPADGAPAQEEAAKTADQPQTDEGQWRPPSLDEPEKYADALATGHEANDAAPLAEFLREWHAASHPVSGKMLRQKPEFEQAVYALFPAFFVPEATEKTGDYLILQDKIDVRLVDCDLVDDYRKEIELGGFKVYARCRPAISEFTVKDFRPAFQAGNKELLYFERSRIDVFARFLTGKHDTSLTESYWDEPNGKQDELDKRGPFTERLDYLNKSLSIIEGHWGTGWHFETHPYVNLLILSKDLKTAVIYYRDGWGGGLALMQCDEKGWHVSGREDTWVE